MNPTATGSAAANPTPRRLFVAGATGATGKVLVRQAQEAGLSFVAHARPGSVSKLPPGVPHAAFELTDTRRLTEALRGCTTVLQLIGTMRKRFDAGDTYETSDVGTTRLLCEAARTAGVDHVVLLSSVGAGRPVGAYLQAKARAEAVVRECGLPWTIFRPSALEGEERRPIPGFGALTRALGLQGLAPIQLSQLAAALLLAASQRAPLGEVLEGKSLWHLVAKARSLGGSTAPI